MHVRSSFCWRNRAEEVLFVPAAAPFLIAINAARFAYNRGIRAALRRFKRGGAESRLYTFRAGRDPPGLNVDQKLAIFQLSLWL